MAKDKKVSPAIQRELLLTVTPFVTFCIDDMLPFNQEPFPTPRPVELPKFSNTKIIALSQNASCFESN
jgi:hypothetical protein